MQNDQIALQLYTVRDLAAQDLPGTLRSVAAAGYQAVEIAGLPDIAPAELARLLADTGLKPISIHEGISGLRADVHAVADRLAEIGVSWAVVPSMPIEDRTTIDGVRRFADDMTRFAAVLGERGIAFGYHNHDFEFGVLDGTTIWDVMLERLGDDVALQIDVYWAAVGGRDPATLIDENATRVRLLHMKDRSADAEPHDAPAGEGTLDFPSIIEAGRAAGVEWYIAEQDHPRAPLDEIASAQRYLVSLAR